MRGAISSRTAGIRLATIVSVLLVPILVLGYFLVTSLKQDISFTQREIDGVRLNRLLQPIVTGAAQKDIRAEDIAAFGREGKALAEATGSSKMFEDLYTSLQASRRDFSQINSKAMAMISANGDSSGLILDHDNNTYHLAASVVANIPDFLRGYAKAGEGKAAVVSPNATEQQRISFMLNIGEWKESFRRLGSELKAAEVAAGNVPFNLKDTTFPQLGKHVGNVDRALMASSFDQYIRKIAELPEFNSDSIHIHGDISALWSRASDALENGLMARNDILEKRMNVSVVSSLLAVVFGIGSAISMFRTTLQRLDSVESANAALETSRAELMSMSSQLQDVNEGVTKLNRDLADKMKALTLAQDENLRRGKMAQLGQLTATVAHELRNPLGAVRTSAYVLERRVTGDDPKIRSSFERIKKGISRCDAIITQLLDFSRGGNIVSRPGDLDQWLTGIVEDAVQSMPENVSVKLQLGLGANVVMFDAGRMTRAVGNIISNASEAMIGSGESVELATANPQITIATVLTERGAEIRISDNGPGISDDVRARIFDPLFTTKSFGTGLGLPAVDNIMQQHGGGLEVQTAEGKGSTFILWLPTGAVNVAGAVA
jgi:signal transduction histidine kinase